jgi:hypothetical protein
VAVLAAGLLSAVAEGAPGARRRPHDAHFAHAAAARTRAVLDDLLAAAAIDQAAYDRATGSYDAALGALATLRGERRTQLRAVVATFDDLAARGQLTPGRLPVLLLTLERNRDWWTSRPLLAVGRRVAFPGSGLVWQHYARQGIQIQWLATFGRANALWQLGGRDGELRALLDEAIALATPRAGGIAWEYLFRFDGGAPPWVSGLAQGTALSALSRAAVRLGEPRYLDAARSALGIFTVAPPEGVLDRTTAGAHYLQYSFAPHLHVLNGFVQALNGLHDFAGLANDDGGRFLFAAGDAEAQAELPGYDTGGWSRYSQRRDSDLSYHRLLRDFLEGLCQRSGEQPYCVYASRFTADLTTAPKLALVAPETMPRQTRKAALSFTLDKPARVTMSVAGKRYARTASARFGSGRHAFAWRPPRAGPYRVRLSATDLAGNTGSTAGTAHVRR